ncbi:MAG: PAS domain S-box protein [Candidatus Omnitrophota bacterium]
MKVRPPFSLRYVPAALALGIGLFSTFFASSMIWQQEHRKLESYFHLSASLNMAEAQYRFEYYIQALESVRSLYGASEEVNRYEFRSFLQPILSRGWFQMIHNVYWAPRVSNLKRKEFEYETAKEGFPDLEIHAWKDGKKVRRDKAKDYFPILFHEGSQIGGKAIGLDLMSVEAFVQPLRDAVATGEVIATPPVDFMLPDFNRKDHGFFIPIYENNTPRQNAEQRYKYLQGVLLMMVDSAEVVRRVFEDVRAQEIEVFLFDSHEGKEQASLVYSNMPHAEASLEDLIAKARRFAFHRLYIRSDYQIGGRKFTLMCFPGENYFGFGRVWEPWFILIGGIIVSVMLSASIRNYAAQTDYVERLVMERTAELGTANTKLEQEVLGHKVTEEKLRASEETWRSLIVNSPNIIMTTDLEGKVDFINHSPVGIAEPPENLIGKRIFDFSAEEYHGAMRESIRAVAETGERKHFDISVGLPDGGKAWYRCYLGAIYRNGQIERLILVALDVTKEKLAEEENRRAREFLDKIMNAVADPIFVKNRRHQWVLLNDAYCKFMGYPREELIGKSDYDYFPKNEADVFWEKDEVVFASGQTNVNDENFTDKSGRLHLISTTKSLYVDPAGNPFIVGIIHDITEQKKAEQTIIASEKLYSNLFEGAPDPIIRLDRNGCYVALNPAAEKAVGRPRHELVGKRFEETEVLTEEAREIVKKEFAFLMNHEQRPPHELEIVQGNDVRILESNPRLIYEKGDIVGIQVIFRDITERKRREEIEVKSRFVSTVSHELRTPLHTIKEGVKVILDGDVGGITEEQEEFLRITYRNIERLSRLINNVLDFQKMESGHLQLNRDRYFINEVAQEVWSMILVMVRNEGPEIELHLTEDLPQALFDRDRIMQVMINLLDNAVKYTRKGKVTLSTWRNENEVIVSVSDTGCGIAQEDLPKLFQFFSRVGEKQKHKAGGTGLGLAISKNIVEEHGGRIWVESKPGKGSTFSFALPL